MVVMEQISLGSASPLYMMMSGTSFSAFCESVMERDEFLQFPEPLMCDYEWGKLLWIL